MVGREPNGAVTSSIVVEQVDKQADQTETRQHDPGHVDRWDPPDIVTFHHVDADGQDQAAEASSRTDRWPAVSWGVARSLGRPGGCGGQGSRLLNLDPPINPCC
jgi:hypothetical protein